MVLDSYRRKRNFSRTKEPAGGRNSKSSSKRQQRTFVVQKHAASRLHYDFRLELDGVLRSWAVPKGPHLNPKVKSLAVEVEDHPLEYASFEGTIPAGEYGGGTVMVWDRGTWETDEDPARSLAQGKITFELQGEKLRGAWSLVRMHGKAGDDERNWLLIKKPDDAAQTRGDILKQQPLSVITGRNLEEISAAEGNKKASSSRKESLSRSKAKRAARKRTSVEQVDGARARSLPKSFAPQLATLASSVPEGDNWLHEVKYDGYRLVAIVDKGHVKLLTRAGNDWTDRFPKLAAELQTQGVETGIFDGEVVVLNRDGISDFQQLQNWLKHARSGNLAYFVFDLPYVNGYDLQQTPLELRKQVLEEILESNGSKPGVVRYGGHILGQGEAVIEQACKLKAEGIVSKRADSPYQQRRTKDWLKIKCSRRQEFVIVGYTKAKGSRTGFGALLLAYFDAGELVYCGRVGTGFTDASLKQLAVELKKLRLEKHPFHTKPKQEPGNDVTWIEPVLVCEVQFTEWSDDGLLRHPSFQGLREDKPAAEVKREDSAPISAKARQKNNHSAASSDMGTSTETAKKRNRAKKAVASNGSHKKAASKTTPVEVAGVRISNPDRVVYPEQGVTKHDLATFYRDIAHWILPHLIDRPLTVVRCPEGQAKACFYQKHLTTPMPEQVHGIPIKEKSKTERYMAIKDLSGLIALVQMGALEFHPWPARADKIEKPDRLVFDLDPSEEVTWGDVIEAARVVHERLEQLGLESFLRTSGGKGLHVVVPLSRRNTWDELKGFAQSVAVAMEREAPDRYIATMSKAKRRGKIFVDYLRNQRGATAVASYSTRARAGAPIATPLEWSELSKKITANHFTVSNLKDRLEKLKRDPWQGFFEVRQSLTKAMLKPKKY